nr:hypothetical protein [Tanacetum cinerariifolium]
LSWNSTDDEGDDDEGKDGDGDEEDDGNDGEEGDDDDDNEDDDGKEEYDEETRDEESFDPIPKTLENSDDERNGVEDLGLNVGREEGHNEEERKMNYTETSILIKEGVYKQLLKLKTRM